MSEEWQNGYRAGYEAGFEAARHIYCFSKTTEIPTKDPNDTDDIEKVYENAYGKDVYRQMKKAHE